MKHLKTFNEHTNPISEAFGRKSTEDFYINDITAEYFGEKEVNDSHIEITQAGWYWADKSDNARYSDWHGVYNTKEDALVAGKLFRQKMITTNFKGESLNIRKTVGINERGNVGYMINSEFINKIKNDVSPECKSELDEYEILFDDFNSHDARHALEHLLAKHGYNIIDFVSLPTNEFFGLSKNTKTDDEKFEDALGNAKPIIKNAYENNFNDEKKKKFFEFVKKHSFKIPPYLKWDDEKGEFIDATIVKFSSIISTKGIGGNGKH